MALLVIYLSWGWFICHRSPKPGTTAVWLVVSSIATVAAVFGIAEIFPAYASVLGYLAVPLMLPVAIAVGLYHVRHLKAKVVAVPVAVE